MERKDLITVILAVIFSWAVFMFGISLIICLVGICWGVGGGGWVLLKASAVWGLITGIVTGVGAALGIHEWKKHT